MVREIHKYFNYIKKQLFAGKKLNFLILYVTSGCNFKCRTCFFHDNLNKENDLSLEEFKKISGNLGNFSILLVGGGEPFLRPDLEDICSLFIKNNKVDTLYIPTNGFLTERILSAAESLLKKYPGITLSINPSLDGMAAYHNKLRGKEGSFSKTMETIQGLASLKERYKNLQIIVNSVVHHENIDELKKLAVYLGQFNLDYHAFEIMRGDYRDKSLAAADSQEVENMHEFILENRKKYFKKEIFFGKISGFLNKMAVLGHINYTQQLKEKFLAGKKWPMRCVAGDSIAVIYPNGDVGLCELKEPVGNLRQSNYNLSQVLSGPEARKQQELIRKNRCRCTHICFINASIAADWKTAFKLPYFYLKAR